MRYLSAVMTLGITLLAWSPAASAVELVHEEEVRVEVNGRLQLLGHVERVDDSFRDQNRMYMFLRQARLGASGTVSDFKYKVQVGFAGEDEAKAPNPGVSLGLLDMYVDAPLKFLGEKTYVRAGQFKTPFGLERLDDPGELTFADRSIQNLALRVGRDIGLTLHTRTGNFVGAVGVFAGGGRDIPERYLPQVLGVPMVMARVGYDGGVYENAFAEEMTGAPAGVRFAVMANGLYTKDSQVGHSTVLNVRQGERSLLINTNWNPFLAQAPTDRGELWQAGGDVSVRVPAFAGVVKGEAEVSYGSYGNVYGNLDILTGRTQVGYERGRFDVALRYAVVRPDSDMQVAGLPVTGGRPFHEVTPALSVTLFNPGTRLVMDLPILLDVPVASEPNVGSYVLTAQPDQTSVLKSGGSVDRRNVVAGRMMFQAAF